MSAPTTHAAPATTTGAAVETTQRQDSGAEVKAPTGTAPSATTSGTPAAAATERTATKENVAGAPEASAAATEPEGGYPEQASLQRGTALLPPALALTLFLRDGRLMPESLATVPPTPATAESLTSSREPRRRSRAR